MNRIRLRKLSIYCFSLSAVLASPVWAQEESAGEVVLEEVTVTASRIEQSLQDVPVAVTALTNVDLELRNIENTRDLQSSVPNISISANTGTASGGRIFIRGIGDDESRIGADSAVAAYVDGVYLARQTGALLDVLDLQRIEVLRGPQGTLYGRNATGGAIKYESVRPDTGANTLDLYGTVGNYDRIDLKAVGNWAVGKNTALRGSVMNKKRDGPFLAWSDASDIGAFDATSARLALQHEFSGGWALYAAVDYVKDKSDPIPTSIPEGFDQDDNIYTLDPAEGLDCSNPAFANWSGCFEDYSSVVETTGFTMDITGPIGDYFTFKSITGYRELEDDLNSNFGIFLYQQQTDQDQFSQEFTLESSYDGPFNFIGGLYYFKEDANLDFLFALAQTLHIKTDAWAIFGEGHWDITDNWRLIGGIRYTDEEKDFVGRNNTLSDLGLSGYARIDNSSFDDTNYRVALQWSVNQDVMLYTSYATGFKSGGYSSDCFGALPVCFNPVDPESVKTWEVGLRSEFVNNRLRLNITYIDNTYEDLQLGGSTPRGFIRFNVPEVETNGFEAEFTFAATENLTLDGYIANLKGNYVELNDDSVAAIAGTSPNPKCGGEIPDEECVINNFDLKNAPEWNYMLGGTYHLQMQSGYFFNFRLSAAYEDDSYNLVANPEAIKRDETTIWDTRISFANPNDTWSISLWGKNLSDEVYYPAGTTVGVGAIPGIPGLAYPGQPRTYGMDFRYTFN